MKRMNLVCGSWGESLLKDLNTMREAKERCDVKLILQGGATDVAHSSVLAAASPFFKSILEGADNPELNMEDFPKDIIRQVLCFVYTGSVDVDMSDLYMLHTVAVDLNIQILQDMVEQVMQTLPQYDGETEETDEQEINKPTIQLKKELDTNDLDEEDDNHNDDDSHNDWPDTPSKMDIVTPPEFKRSSPRSSRSRRADYIAAKKAERSQRPQTSAMMVTPETDAPDEGDSVDQEILDEENSLEIDENSDDPEFSPDQDEATTTKKRKGRSKNIKNKRKKTKIQPHSIIIKKSAVPGAGTGVFTCSVFPESVAFGPYPKKTDEEPAPSNTPNWLKYINFATDEADQNVEAYDYKGYTFFRTCKDVDIDTELLLWCKEDKEKLGIAEPNDDGADVFGLNPICLPSGRMFDAPDQRYDCVECGVAYVTEKAYHVHMRRKHDQPIPVDIYKEMADEKQRRASTQMDPSIRKVQSTNAALILQSIMPQRRRSRRGENKPKFHECPVCHRTFGAPSTLRQHIIIHTEDKPHQCPHCGRGFKQLGNLTTHLKVHTGEKPFKCDKCGKGFTEQSNFRRHWRIHTGEKPYLCITCGKGFSQFTHLETHTRLHTGERPFQCTQCDKTFREKSSLAIHTKRHGVKEFLCPICNMRFFTSSEFTNHKIIHHTTEETVQEEEI